MNNWQGFIKLHRNSFNDELYWAEPFTKWQAWVDLLMQTNFSERTFFFRGIEVAGQRGCFYISERNLAERWGWSRNKVRRFLAYLVSVDKIVPQTIPQKKNVIACYSVVNYDKYQLCDTTESTTNDTTSETTERPQPKNYKNYKNDNRDFSNEKSHESAKPKSALKRFVKPTIEELQQYIKDKKYHFSAQGFFDFYESKGWMIGKNHMKDWKAACRTWEAKRKEETPSEAEKKTAMEERYDKFVVFCKNSCGNLYSVIKAQGNHLFYDLMRLAGNDAKVVAKIIVAMSKDNYTGNIQEEFERRLRNG